MEPWEKYLISQNWADLISRTDASSMLLAVLESEGILNRADIKRIKSQGDQRFRLELLYSILITRVNGYNQLKNAFLQTNQTGALQILLNAEESDIVKKYKSNVEELQRTQNKNLKADEENRVSGSIPDNINDIVGIETDSVLEDTRSSSEDNRYFNVDKISRNVDTSKSGPSLDTNAPRFQKCLNDLTKMLGDSNISFIFIATMDTLLTVEKIESTLSEMNVKVKKMGLRRELKIFLSVWKNRAFMSGNEMMPVLVLHDSIKKKLSSSVEKLLLKVFSFMKTHINLKIIIVMNADQSQLEGLKSTCFRNSDQVGVITDSFLWNDLTENWQAILLSRQIADQGQQRSLKEFCESYVYEQWDLFCKHLINGKLLVDLVHYEELPVIFRQTIPPVNHYIQRILRTRCIISKTIFQTNSENEICLFTGFNCVENWEEITKGCKGTVDLSGSQLAQDKITANFILLSMSGHLDKVVHKTGPKKSIHLIHFSDDKLTWIKTVGNCVNLVQMSLCDEELQKEVPEGDFFQELEYRNLILEQFHSQIEECTVLVADSPGMGKSVLLAHLAEETRKLYSSRMDTLVFYFVMTDFIAAIQKRQHEKEKSLEVLDTVITEEIMSYCSNYKLDICILAEFTKQSNFKELNRSKDENKTGRAPLCMFFDGLDEVTTDNIPLSLTCFERIKTLFSRVRLHVSTRPILLQQLENSLCTLGYNIQPFSISDQKDFLRMYWSKARYEPKLVPEKLDEYGERCLQIFESTFTKDDKDFAGIPLQCLLLAELFENDAVEYADPTNVKLIDGLLPTIQVKSISQLYKNIVNRKFQSYFMRTKVGEHDKLKIIYVMEKLHFYISIQIIFPGSEWIENLRHIFLSNQTYKQLRTILPNWKCSLSEFKFGELPQHPILAIGILEDFQETRWQFIHRTFAEYFIAHFASKYLNERDSSDNTFLKLKQFVEKVVLNTARTSNEVFASDNMPQQLSSIEFKYPVICHFINSLLEQSLQPFSRHISLKQQPYGNIIQACIYGKYENILQRYSYYIDRKNTEKMKNLLELASQSSLKIFKHISHDQLPKYRSCVLKISIREGNWPIFSYLINNSKEKNEDLSNEILPLLVQNTKTLNSEIIDAKAKILTSLLDCNPTLILDPDRHGLLPFMQTNVNIQLLEQLLMHSKVEDILEEKDNNFRTILHIAAEYLNAGEYTQLIQALKKLNADIPQSLLKCRDIFNFTPLHYFVLHQEPSSDLFYILNENGADFSLTDETGYSVLWTAIKKNVNLENLKHLTEIQDNSRNSNSNDQFNRTTLHIAAQHYSDNSLLQILSEKIYVDSEDAFGNTPIFYALRNAKPFITNSHIRFLHSKNACVLHRNKNGETLMHVSAQLGRVKTVELLFQLGFSMAAVSTKYDSSLVSLTDCKGNTPLHYSLRNNYENKWALLQLLVDRFPSDVNQLNNRGECPLHYALKSKYANLSVEIIEFLIPKISHWPAELISLAVAYLEKFEVKTEQLIAIVIQKRASQ